MLLILQVQLFCQDSRKGQEQNDDSMMTPQKEILKIIQDPSVPSQYDRLGTRGLSDTQ